jgi:hypothetical protein
MENKTDKAYKAIFKVLKKYKDAIVFDIDNLAIKAAYHLFGIKLKEKYGLNINPKDIYSLDYQKLKDNVFIGWFGHKYNRTISWPDDDTQPEDELLLYIDFPTGAYIFGSDYPSAFFQKFFSELKKYNPKYTDSHNKSLYFSMDNASKIFNEYDIIIKRYHEENAIDIKKRGIRKMEDELLKLKSKK